MALVCPCDGKIKTRILKNGQTIELQSNILTPNQEMQEIIKCLLDDNTVSEQAIRVIARRP